MLTTGEALSTIGDQKGAMERFSKALSTPHSDRVAVRLAIAHVMAQQNHTEDAERQIALAFMEAEAGATAPASGTEYIQAADIFRQMHEYDLSITYLGRAGDAGAPDIMVRTGMANTYLAVGDVNRAAAELAAGELRGQRLRLPVFVGAGADIQTTTPGCAGVDGFRAGCERRG